VTAACVGQAGASVGSAAYDVVGMTASAATIGKASFEVNALRDNLMALIADLQKAKPSASKGQYLKRVTVSSTMGPGVVVDSGTLSA